MIIWLASYPRSGNTLFRTIMYQCFGMGAYDMDRPATKAQAEANRRKVPMHHITGSQRFPDKTWQAFYKRASRSDEMHLVKSHLLPLDKQPAIYIIRDGRSSTLSYLKYMTDRVPEANRTLTEILCGEDYYGKWSDHVQAWTQDHDCPILILRFDELVHCSMSTLERIAKFIDYQGDVQPWENPKAEMHELAPWFIGEGKTEWESRSPWSEHYDLLFYVFNGGQMKVHGYYDEQECHRLGQHPDLSAYQELADYIDNLQKSRELSHGSHREWQRIVMYFTGGRLIQLVEFFVNLKRRLFGSKGHDAVGNL